MVLKKEKDKPLIVCITGLPGSGKTTVADALKGIGFTVISMGDVVRREAKKRGLELTDANLGKVMLELRSIHGPDAIAMLVGEDIRRLSADEESEGDGERGKGNGKGNCYFAVDGLRSIREAERLKEYGAVKVLAVHASRERRFNFLLKRGRSDAPSDIKEFYARDKREIDVGIAEAIALSDAIVSNDTSKDELVKNAISVVQRWVEEYNRDGNQSFN
ncbi:Dephospho-CoA kinase [archaeon HR04]|nr:Dephospho-CoA kinase [archaeon HR04]